MANFFKKAMVFTDLHLGLKSNSIAHNDDCLNFVKWAIAKGKEEGCETLFFLGDWHNNRASINIVTLNYSLKALELLSQAFNVFFIPGNHDLYYRDKRDVQSAEWARHIPNVHIVNDFFTESDITIVPWLVGDDHKKISKIKSKYVFGHFELPHFYMNAMVQMPDNGEIKREDFTNAGHVFSGHFHKRQSHNNITYVGNCFPHNYADAGDDSRGVMILEWGKEPTFHAWPDQPRYRVYALSELLADPDNLLTKGMHVRINLDIDISYEEATFIKETFVGSHSVREITLLPSKRADVSVDQAPGAVNFESVDQIVVNQISQIQKSDQYDPALLMDIYRHL